MPSVCSILSVPRTALSIPGASYSCAGSSGSRSLAFRSAAYMVPNTRVNTDPEMGAWLYSRVPLTKRMIASKKAAAGMPKPQAQEMSCWIQTISSEAICKMDKAVSGAHWNLKHPQV
jgi:hypothetical protein